MTDTATEEKETAEEVVTDVLPEDTDSVENEEKKGEDSQEDSQEEKKEEFVPVSAHVAERKKRQEAEQRAQWLEQQMMQQSQNAPQQQTNQADNSDDLLTVGQQQQALEKWKRSILEESYMEQNPEIVERIKTELPEVISDPRHKWLADSISQAPNRLQRAAQVLEMFKPKKQAVPAPNRQNTPKSPQSVAKTNKLSIADRLMSMSDQELEEWRVSQKQKVR